MTLNNYNNCNNNYTNVLNACVSVIIHYNYIIIIQNNKIYSKIFMFEKEKYKRKCNTNNEV